MYLRAISVTQNYILANVSMLVNNELEKEKRKQLVLAEINGNLHFPGVCLDRSEKNIKISVAKSITGGSCWHILFINFNYV
jgi:hypothetical protein